MFIILKSVQECRDGMEFSGNRQELYLLLQVQCDPNSRNMAHTLCCHIAGTVSSYTKIWFTAILIKVLTKCFSRPAHSDWYKVIGKVQTLVFLYKFIVLYAHISQLGMFYGKSHVFVVKVTIIFISLLNCIEKLLPLSIHLVVDKMKFSQN